MTRLLEGAGQKPAQPPQIYGTPEVVSRGADGRPTLIRWGNLHVEQPSPAAPATPSPDQNNSSSPTRR